VLGEGRPSNNGVEVKGILLRMLGVAASAELRNLPGVGGAGNWRGRGSLLMDCVVLPTFWLRFEILFN